MGRTIPPLTPPVAGPHRAAHLAQLRALHRDGALRPRITEYSEIEHMWLFMIMKPGR